MEPEEEELGSGLPDREPESDEGVGPASGFKLADRGREGVGVKANEASFGVPDVFYEEIVSQPRPGCRDCLYLPQPEPDINHRG
jgi:hypothetical protein